MKNLTRLSKVEKFILATTTEDYVSYHCEKHGVFQLRKDSDSGKCAYNTCTAKVSKIDNIEELQLKYKLELGLID